MRIDDKTAMNKKTAAAYYKVEMMGSCLKKSENDLVKRCLRYGVDHVTAMGM